MTGPRSATVQPHRTRARPLLPFLAGIFLSLSACTDSTTPNSSEPVVSPASVRLHPYLPPKLSQTASGTSFLRAGQSAQLVSLGTATASTSRILLLADADGASTTALANSIADAGFLVTVRPAPEYTWDGTNPSLDGFDLVIHLNGNTVGPDFLLSADAQATLVNFVRGGGGFIGSQWSGYETGIGQDVMQDLVLMGFNGDVNENCFSCGMTYTQVPELQDHPVLVGIPSSFSFEADGHVSGELVDFATEGSLVLMQVPSGAPGVAVRSLSAGKVVNFSFAPNYGLGGDGQTLLNPTIRQLYVNAVHWALGESTPAPSKSPATISLSYGVTTYDGTAKAVSATTSPVGLSGVVVTYSQNGVAVEAPTNAGVYQVVATLDNPDYEAPQATGTLTILPADPVIQWAPSTMTQGMPLSSTQLNAIARDLSGSTMAGEFFYLPSEGTILPLGAQPVSVEFQPINQNYKNVIATVTITVVQPTGRLKFHGFFKPVHNMPMLNAVAAGRAVPVRFSVEGALDSRVLKQGSPTSVEIGCSAAASRSISETADEELSSQLLSRGTSYTYVWKTSPSWAGRCRKLIVTLVDGTQHSAIFRFSKEQKAKVAKPVQEKNTPSRGGK
jgi:hypothetical protein